MERLTTILWRTTARARIAFAAVRSFPFTYPRLAQILFATCSGVFLSAGTGLFLDAFSNPERALPARYWSGAMFGLSSFALAGVAWAAQGFQEYLIAKEKAEKGVMEVTTHFQSWQHRHLARALYFTSILFAVLAFLCLII
ncbi:hypothetical protein HGA89_01030 [bacterium]|nr:hypothetical protein [bacterium]